MIEQSRLVSRRTVLRGAFLGGTGLIAAYAIGCGDDDDEEVASATPTPASTVVSGEKAKAFKLVDGWYRDKAVRYYDFGMNSPASGATVATAPIWVFITGMDAAGMPVFAEGQHNIIDAVVGDAGYSDLWQVNMVTVPDDYKPDSIRSRQEVEDSGYDVKVADLFVNCPVVPGGSTLEGGEKLVQGWYKGEEVVYPDFGPNPTSALPIWVFITGMDAEGNPQLTEGQGNIIDSVPGEEGYSAFWRVNMVTVPEDYEPNSVTSAQGVVDGGFSVVEVDMVVNCPVTVF